MWEGKWHPTLCYLCKAPQRCKKPVSQTSLTALIGLFQPLETEGWPGPTPQKKKSTPSEHRIPKIPKLVPRSVYKIPPILGHPGKLHPPRNPTWSQPPAQFSATSLPGAEVANNPRCAFPSKKFVVWCDFMAFPVCPLPESPSSEL